MVPRKSSKKAAQDAYGRRKQNYDQDQHDRLIRIINDKVGEEREFAGHVNLSGLGTGRKPTDDELLADVIGDVHSGAVVPLWCDGSFRSGEKDDALGAAVSWRWWAYQGKADWAIEKHPLGRDSGDNHDAELFALAAATKLAVKSLQEHGPFRLVRIFSDSARVLQGLQRGTLCHLGPAVSSPWGVENLYDDVDFLEVHGVQVELVWVPGHGLSEGMTRTDKAAVEAAEAAKPKKEGWMKREDMSADVHGAGTDTVEEWFQRLNKRKILDGEEEPDEDAMSISDGSSA